VDGQCMTVCGDKHCHPDTQVCKQKTMGGQTYDLCVNSGCTWGTLTYVPENELDADTTIRTCSAGTDLISCNDPAGIKHPYTKSSNTKQSDTSKAQCTEDDCYERVIEDGVIKANFDTNNNTCSATFDCGSYLSKCDKCPLEKPYEEACCMDSKGKFTGQVCPMDQICSDGQCIYGYQCTGDVAHKHCVPVTQKPGPGISVFNSLDECNKDCYVRYSCNIDGVCIPSEDGDKLDDCQSKCHVSHTCNCTYLGGGDEPNCELTSHDCGSRKPSCYAPYGGACACRCIIP
jgi:hypothetical protein